MRVLITGSRTWTNMAAIRRELSALPKDTTIIHGTARGADSLADEVARELGLKIERYAARWHQHDPNWCRCAIPHPPICRGAGHERNARMVATKPDKALAFSLRPLTPGTAQCVLCCVQEQVPVKVISE